MNVLWCWRCREDVPMLDDDEWALIMRAHQHWDDPERSLAVINAERATRGLTPLKPEPMERHPTQHRYQYLLAGYQLFTGVEESNPNVVWLHFLPRIDPFRGDPGCVVCAQCHELAQHLGRKAGASAARIEHQFFEATFRSRGVMPDFGDAIECTRKARS